MQQRVSKPAFTNIIRQLDSHNKFVEEKDCWRQYNASRQQQTVEDDRVSLQGRDSNDSYSSASRSGGLPPTRSVGSSAFGTSAHMDCADDLQRRSYEGREEGKSGENFHMIQFYNAEAADPDRWGHAGYKELYPGEFGNKDKQQTSTDDSSSEEKKKRKKKKSRGLKRPKSDVTGAGNDELIKKQKKSKKSKSSSERSKKKHKKRRTSDSDEIEHEKNLDRRDKKELKKRNCIYRRDDEGDCREDVAKERSRIHSADSSKINRREKVLKDKSDTCHSSDSDGDYNRKKKRRRKDSK